jgi:ethanolamine utilization protein EutN
MKAGKVIGRVVATHKYKSLEGKKILLLKPMTWEEIDEAVNNGNDNAKDKNKSIIALDAVGAGASEYVFYVSSKEACQAFTDDPVCHNAIIGIIDGIDIRK